MHNYHRVWAEVNLDAIRANMESFRDNGIRITKIISADHAKIVQTNG